VTAAVDVFTDPAGYLALASKHSIRSLVDRLLVIVDASAKKMAAVFGPDIQRHPHYREALIEVAVVSNAALCAHALQREIEQRDAHGVRSAYGVYLLAQRTVWAPRRGTNDVIGLASPPEDAQGFVEFGDAVLRSRRIASLLGA
jgi:carbonic anhydrase